MNKIKKTLAVFFIAIFYLTSSVYAQVAASENARELAFDYALFSGKLYEVKEGEEKIEFQFYNGTYNICENEKKTIPVLIVNKGTTDSNYSLDAAGASWVSLNVREFSLAKKQNGVVFLDLSPGQNTNGEYNVEVNSVSSEGNIKRNLGIDINVEKCYSVNVNIEKEEDKVCGGVKKQYRGEVANDGKQENDVELAVKGPNWATIDKNIFSINAGDKQEFELSADVPANARGLFDIIVSSTIKDLLSIKSEKNLRIEVVPKYDCYKAEVIADAKITNYYSNAYILVKIRNSGIKQADYDIGLEAPDWISIEPEKINVNPGQTGNLNLNINPNAEIAEGTYPIKINVEFENMAYSKNIEVALSKGNPFFKRLKSFFIFYQYYIYAALIAIIILFLFRRQISNKIKTKYKNYKIRKARLRALEKAREALSRKRTKKETHPIKKSEFKIKKPKTKKILAFAILIILVLSLSFSIYQFNFPFSKEFVKTHYAYFIAGILISLFIIFIIEFYKSLIKLLRK